ncbi:hypothetical protein NDA07_03750 [Microcoleus vaginatus DQ-U2]|uniref:hypothetical protein n=1 Tax=Microcoleus vaginatus TaxID=119532 RepID=UPI00168A0694|nr:hypothetical protein [Microcoleus sp. FACHB-DQ6]
MAKKLFPPERFEWLPPPKEREWRTNDGVHLIRSDARDFAEFLRDKLLSTDSGGFSWHRAYKKKLVIYIELWNTTK